MPISSLFLKGDMDIYRAAVHHKAHLLVVDLEDSVPMPQKSIVRQLISRAISSNVFNDSRVLLRLNQLSDVENLSEDLTLSGSCVKSIFGFLLPKINSANDVVHYEELLNKAAAKFDQSYTNSFRLFPIVETQRAVENAFEIAKASPLVTGMYFGDADLSTSMGIQRNMDNISYARQKFILDATAAGVYPIDGAFTKIDDIIGLESEALQSKALGFCGKTAIHPKQLPTINKVFSVSKQELEWAQRVTASMTDDKSDSRPSYHSSRNFFGPPHLELAEKILMKHRSHPKSAKAAKVIKPKLVAGGFDFNSPDQLGVVHDCEFELSVTDGIMALWDGLLFNSNRVSSSNAFAQSIGFKDRLIPNSLLMTLTASLAVSKYSETAKVHLAFKNPTYLVPVYPGDSLRGHFVVVSVKLSSSGKGSIVRSIHFLENQRGETVYRLEKVTLFDNAPYEGSVDETTVSRYGTEIVESLLLDKVMSIDTTRFSPKLWRLMQPKAQQAAGDLIIHRMVKVFERSEVGSMSNIIRATNSHHHDKMMFTGEELLVPGPFVTHSSLSCAGIDFGEVIYEEFLGLYNLAKVNHGDQLCAMTYVKRIEPVPNNPGLEKMHLVTIGLKNININDLAQEEIPALLFDTETSQSSIISGICEHHIPLLLNRVVCKTEYVVIRCCRVQ